MNNPKQEVQKLLYNLPEDCSLADIQYHLYVLNKINNGIDAIEKGQTFSNEQVVNHFNQKIKKWSTV